MEPLALLPPELTALVDPQARITAPRQGVQDGAGAGVPGADAFAQFLAVFLPALGGGQELPAAGKPLPLALPEGELASAAPEPTGAAQTEGAAAPAATTAGLAVWLALQGGSSPTVAVANGAADTLLLATASVPSAPASVGSETVPGPLPAPSPSPSLATGTAVAATAVADAAVGAAGVAAADRVPQPLEPPSAAVGSAAVAEVLDDPAFDLAGLESRLAANQRRVEARPVVPPAPQSDAAAPAAAWLAPAGEAAVQAAARATDASAAGRGMRRLETLAVASAAPPLAEPIATVVVDWLPPNVASGPSAPSAPAAAIPLAPQQAPVDTRTPEWHEALASRVQWLVDQQVGEARIKLNPPELGAVDVKISLVEDKTYVQLTAATAAARDELTQGLPRLRDLFTASGLELGGASVQGGRGGHSGGGHSGGGGYEGTLRHGADLADLERPLPGELLRGGRRMAGAIDVFA